MLAKKTIDEVREINLVDALSKFLPDLKKSGANYTAKSPFTDEKTGSFVISPTKNIWKCFSTGKGGNNAVSFLMESKHLSYVEAIKTLADNHNIIVEFDESEKNKDYVAKQEKIQDIANINTHAMEFWMENLKNRPFEFRRSSMEMDEVFNLGYAPNEWHDLQKYLVKKGYSDQQMEAAGLIKKGEKGYFDFFRNRVIFPIYDIYGKIIGFSGRLTEKTDDGNKTAKVLNSIETEAFSKTRALLGIFQAKQNIITKGAAILVEGNYDVTSMHQLGFDNTIASLGTAFTDEHIKLIKKYSKNLCFFIDNDKAGLKSIEKNTFLALENGMQVSLFIPEMEGTDPDDWCQELIKEHKELSPEVAKQIFNEGITDAVEYLAQIYFSGKEKFTTVQETEAEQKLSKLLACVSDGLLRNKYVKKFAKVYNIDKSVVEKSVSIIHTERAGNDENDTKKFKPKAPLTEDELEDFYTFGFYPDKRKGKIGYYFGNEQVTNWLMRPLFQVKDIKDSNRFIELTTEKGKIVVEIANSKINNGSAFETAISNHGGYFLHASTKQYQRLKSKFLLQFPLVTEIKTLGWYHDGFFAFANGTVDNGVFRQVDDYGITVKNNNWYFLPAYSSIYKDLDKDNDTYAADRNFVFKSGGIGFEKWAKKFNSVYNENHNGMFAISYLCSVLFSDIPFKMNNWFPILFGYGQPRTGKSTMARSTTRVFKVEYSAYNLNSGTMAGYQRVVSRVRNTIEHLDEYRNDLPEEKFQFLKRIYDRSSAPKGQMTNDNKTVEQKINASVVVTGQHYPSRDGNSLATRSVCLNFEKTADKFEESEIKEFNELTEIENSGLSDVIVEILRFRAMVEKHYNDYQFEIFNELRAEFENKPVDGRVCSNYTVLLAVVKILKDCLKFPFTYDELYKKSLEFILAQSELITKSDELAEFFDMLQFLSLQHQIQHNEDYIVKTGVETIKVGRGDKTEIKAVLSRNVLYIRMAKIFPLYKESIRRQGLQGLDQQTIISYMRTHRAYLGEIKSVRFGADTTSALAFDYGILDIVLKTDAHIKSPEPEPITSTPSPSTGTQGSLDDDLPF